MRIYASEPFKTFILPVLCGCLFCLQLFGAVSKDLKPPCKIVSFLPDFYSFWKKAKDLPLQERIKLWDELFEAKHPDFYREVIYAGREGEILRQFKEQKLQNFLSELTEKNILEMKAREQELTKLIPLVAQKVDKVFPPKREETTHYIIPSLNVTSGAGSPYRDDLIIFYGIEFMVQFDDPGYIKEMIAHQILHVIHYRKIAPFLWKKYGANRNLNVLLDREGPLFFIFREGLAISFAEGLFPGGDRPGIREKNVPVFEESFQNYTKKFLQDLRNFTPEVYENYFSGTQENSEPPGFGFFLGYKIVKSFLQVYPMEELIRWSPERAVQAVWSETKKIIDK